MTTIEYPRVLVVSNNSFAENNSNGRTLGVFFKGWPKDRLAQFCISTTQPDYSVCQNYYMITDSEALSAFKSFRKARRVSIEENKGSAGKRVVMIGKSTAKTATKALLRQVVWGNKRFASTEFNQWIERFKPEVVLVMNSDSGFMLEIGQYIAKYAGAKLTMFNTEGFYLFKRNFLAKKSFLDSLSFTIYHAFYRHKYKQFMKHISHAVYANNMLANDYKKEFPHEAQVFYTSSEVNFDESDVNVTEPVFSYLGNFAFERHRALIEISEVLQSINSLYKLHLYGRCFSKEMEEMLVNAPGIVLHGFVPYSEVKEAIAKSTILFHAEVKDEKYKEALRYGFSTKIADSISSGHPFLMYSSSHIAGASYLIETGAGWFAEDKIKLKAAIEEILNNEERRLQVKQRALEIRNINHNFERNKDAMREFLVSLVNNVK